MADLPRTIVVVDVETTGLHSKDRIISLGAWRLNTEALIGEEFPTEYIHIIADPGKKSHPKAEEVHGYSDWTLRYQQPFSENAEVIREFLSSGDLLIAHNASFDLEFINREYRILGKPGPESKNYYCTMNGYRQSGLPGRASLNAICQEMGLRRSAKNHGALEDAWLALMVYFWLHRVDKKYINPFTVIADKGAPVIPSNFREPPPQPEGPLPRRSRLTSPLEADESPRAARGSKSALLNATRPTAILLIEVVRADSPPVADEIDVLSSLIRSTRARLGLVADEELEQEVLAELIEIVPTQNLLTRAARAVYENSDTRDVFPSLLAEAARRDGKISEAERAAIERVKAAISRVLAE